MKTKLYNRRRAFQIGLEILFSCLFFLSAVSALASSQNDLKINWRELPVLPTGISEKAREILREGLIEGHNPHSFSKIGDCYASTSWFITDFDLGEQYYNLGPFEEEFAPVIAYYQGSFGVHSRAAKPGFTAASLLSPTWITLNQCDDYDNPLMCELMAQNSLFAIFSIGTNDAFNPDQFKDNLREAIEFAITQKRLPILMTKADDIEGGHRINQDIADLAAEYELPVVNFWAAVQDLPHKGLQQDGVHLTFYKNDFSDPRAYDAGWTFRNISTLYMLKLIMNETIALQSEIGTTDAETVLAAVAPTAVPTAVPAARDEEHQDAIHRITLKTHPVAAQSDNDAYELFLENNQKLKENQDLKNLINFARNITETLAERIFAEIAKLRHQPRNPATAEDYYRYNPVTFIPGIRSQKLAVAIKIPALIENYNTPEQPCPVPERICPFNGK